ncbi:MAG: transcription elongation factor spt5 [Chrysothrix sp. TS-e1954]|nr:MAG: transcription elongation factor spt5 [Chrysothrix sp. TS-e1954]
MTSLPGYGDEADSENGDLDPQPAFDGPSGADKEASSDNMQRSSSRDGVKATNGISDIIDGDDGPADDEDEEGPGEDLGDGNDDDDEDEDEDDEEEVKVGYTLSRQDQHHGTNDQQGHRRKRARGERRNQFVDEEAEVDDEDEELDEEDEGVPEGDRFVADTHPDDVGLDARAGKDDRRHRELDMQRERLQEPDIEAEAARLKRVYGRKQREPGDALVIPKRMLLPSVNDPTIWGVRCKPGREREVVLGIMRRVEHLLAAGKPVNITAAFERGGTMSTMAGLVYVEARKQTDVVEMLDGLPSAFPRLKTTLVPINEMPDLLKVQASKILVVGNYVRIKKTGVYKGDLARVSETDTNGLEVDLHIIPRIEYAAPDDNNAPTAGLAPDGTKRKRGFMKTGPRPAQRLFNEQDARKAAPKQFQNQSNYSQKKYLFQGNTYASGFLEKTFKVKDLVTEGVNPTLAEVTMFTSEGEDGTENLDLTAIAQTLKASSDASSYLPGDMVEIYQGEQAGVCGKAVGVHGDIVTLRVEQGPLQGQSLQYPVRSLRKRFREGDHVKVVGGSKYQDEVGMVVRIKDDRVTILNDSNHQELTVFSKDLRAASDSNIVNTSSKFDIHDLVQLDPATVGVVTKVDRESVRVIDQNASLRTLLSSSIPNRLDRRRLAVATDKDGTEVRLDDTVKEASGEQRAGRVMYIHRTYLFLYNREATTENAGVFVARSSGVLTLAAKGRANNNTTGPDLGKMNPALQRSANGAGMPPAPVQRGPDRLLGKTIQVKKGSYKGMMGIVKDTTQHDARVELHTKNRLVTIPKEIMVVKDPSGNHVDIHRFYGNMRAGPNAAPSNPHAPGGSYGAGSATPRPHYDAGGRTPAGAGAYGGMTPGFGGSKTPMWGATRPGLTSFQSGSRTPAGAGGLGNRTVYGGSGGGAATSYGSGGGAATSHWNPNNPTSATPFHSGFSGGRTPAGAGFGSSRTPLHASYADAATPGFAAATPADHPTPRGAAPYGGRGTPYGAGAGGETPFHGARTPGIGGGGGGGGGGDEGYE